MNTSPSPSRKTRTPPLDVLINYVPCIGALLCRHYYSKAVKANPYHAVAHFNLGLLLHDEDLETAMEHYQVIYK